MSDFTVKYLNNGGWEVTKEKLLAELPPRKREIVERILTNQHNWLIEADQVNAYDAAMQSIKGVKGV